MKVLTRSSLVMVLPFRTGYYSDYAKFFEESGLLRLVVLGTRRLVAGVPPAKQVRQPFFGLYFYITAKLFSPYRGEALRFGMYPLYDRWALGKLRPGDSVFSSYGYANRCFQFARRFGGKTLLDAGNSHPQTFWDILTKEHHSWGCPVPPISPAHHRRSLAMMREVDCVLAPSRFVEESFLGNGFSKEQIFRLPYATDLTIFRPGPPRTPDRPFTIINTGGLSLRKGTPYLLEALSILKKRIPGLRILLTRQVSDSIKPILARYDDLPIEWSETLPPALLAERLRRADLFILPSLEEGMARTALEAMACGLPVILTPNTGASDLVQEGVSGSIVPIRDSNSIVEKALFWSERIRANAHPKGLSGVDLGSLAYPRFRQRLEEILNSAI